MRQPGCSSQRVTGLLLAAALGFGPGRAPADDQRPAGPAAKKEAAAPAPPSAEDEARLRAAERAAARAAAQKALNDQVLAREFKVEDPRKIEEQVEEQLKKKVQPVEQAPVVWRVGWTCQDLLQLRPVDWLSYRNCRYYYRYYGRYWR